MKNLFVLFGIIFIMGSVNAQYEAAMAGALSNWREGNTKEALATLERIIAAEKEKWIPAYYVANILISSSFEVGDMEERNKMLERSKEFIKTAHDRSPDNSEIYTLEGMLYTGYVAADPETYGMMYSQKIMELHRKALELNPDNPRAMINLIEYEMGSARFFGTDMGPLCERVKKVLPKFENQKQDEPFAPTYGIERAQQLLDSCE
jgi:tetratricopeptide (TPR) repeat protein